jgi:ABC-2 type transport system ATP-binding protein
MKTDLKNLQTPDLALETNALRKIYREAPADAPPALSGIDLAVPRGSFFGLLGPNGAGKSTFINIVAGLVVRTSGSVKIWGFDIEKDSRLASAAIGVVPQELNIDPFFTPREVLEFQAGLYGVPKAERRSDEILAAMRLSDKADAYTRNLSGGMRRRLLVAKALVHAPPVLILDEPTAGVDVELRQQLWEYVQELNSRGVTIILTTHYLEEAEALCDRIAIINHGEVVACDDTATLLKQLDSKELIITTVEPLTTLPSPLARHDAKMIGPHQLAVHYRPSRTQISDILASTRTAGLTIADLTTRESDLEDVFLALTSSGNDNHSSQ